MIVESTGPSENQEDADRIATEWIARGSTIFSDRGAAFNHMAAVTGGTHGTVNHSKTFVDPVTGINSNTVEGRNKQMKEFLKRSGRTFAINDNVLWGNLAQYIWQQWFTDGSKAITFGMFFLAMYDQWGFARSTPKQAMAEIDQ
jgi:hypothetical protein